MSESSSSDGENQVGQASVVALHEALMGTLGAGAKLELLKVALAAIGPGLFEVAQSAAAAEGLIFAALRLSPRFVESSMELLEIYEQASAEEEEEEEEEDDVEAVMGAPEPSWLAGEGEETGEEEEGEGRGSSDEGGGDLEGTAEEEDEEDEEEEEDEEVSHAKRQRTS
jgi:hypothetical protein